MDLAEEAHWPREVLDRDYNARASVEPDVFEDALRRYRALSETARERVAGVTDLVYDQFSSQTIDLYGIGGEPRPVFLFIHGGYWRALSKEDSAFMAPALARQGIATAVVDYRLAPAVGLTEIVREVRAAAAFLHREGAAYGIDPSCIFVGGSSAGGHLTGTILSGGWHDDFGVPGDLVKGAFPVSGLFHLAPIARSFVQEWISLSEEEVTRLSPAENLPAVGCPMVVAYAEGEPAGFARQSETYHGLWQEKGFDGSLLAIPGRNHFDVILDLADEKSVLFERLVGMIRDGAA
ncbi:alpha/beta hydrolase [Nitratireductor sp. GCM10026969]|uniref:alpha/beta hydrolase n=1 Tax=Nitratireductor sp. GCM10026969 TaxID=3252645 RepID=UPI003608DC23